MNTNINLLLPQDEESLRKRKRVKIFNAISVLVLVGVGILSFFIFLLIKMTDVGPVLEQQNEISRKIIQLQDIHAKLNIANDRIDNIKEVLSDRTDLSTVTGAILEKVPTGLSIADLSMSDTSFTITVESTSLLPISQIWSDQKK
jgi:Tfp pilus assembly protein PilN